MCADGITQLKGSSRVAVYRDVHHLVLQSRRGLRASEIAKVTVSHDSPCAGRYFACIYAQIGDSIDATSYSTLNRSYVNQGLACRRAISDCSTGCKKRKKSSTASSKMRSFCR